MPIWTFQGKSSFRLYLQCCRRLIYNLYLTNQLKPIWTCFKNTLVPSDIYFSIKVSALCYFCNSYQCSSKEKIVDIITGLGDMLLNFLYFLVFLYLLSTINYEPVSIGIDVELVCIGSHCTKKEFSIMGFFSKCDQIRNFLQIWSNLLNKSLIERFIFCAVCVIVTSIICSCSILSL